MNPGPRYLILLLTTECNLRCRYCYRGEGFKIKSMPRETIQTSLEYAAASGKPFHVQMTGGEPTLEPDLIEWTASTIRKAGWPATIGLQTNGTLVDRSLIKICERYQIQIGVSLDGPLDVQEKLRGQATATLKGLKLIDDQGLTFGVTTVVTRQNVMQLGRLALMLGMFAHVKGLGLDLLVQKGRAETIHRATPASPEALRTGLMELLNMLEKTNQRRSRPIQLREMELVRRSFSRKKTGKFCHACKGESMAVHPDGTVYPCGQTVGDPDWACGRIDQPDLLRLKALSSFRLQGAVCSDCPLNGHCPGDCPSRQYYNDPESAGLACVMYKTLRNSF